ncbi:hypothetical protein [Kingella sp. (in: b-proteobacteria)]|nr:hypothetical protein [Kingella sp. (in: b-proteobacteria)]MDO4656418.1 hypothetical protein [Kingella sp. (in: b-proteobacteria)]
MATRLNTPHRQPETPSLSQGSLKPTHPSTPPCRKNPPSANASPACLNC